MSYNSNNSYYKPGGGGMSRGRGYPSGPMRGPMRGGMRGSSDGGTWRGAHGGPLSRGRGYNMHSTRGSSNTGTMGSNYNSGSGSWYNKDNAGHTGQQSYRGDRYAAGSRPSDTRYQSNRGSSIEYGRRYSRPDSGSGNYTTREHNRSPEAVPRKRLRPDGYSPASSRRSQEGSYEYSASRFDYSDKSHSSYSNEERERERGPGPGRPLYREDRDRDRRPSADRRDDYHSPRSREPREHRDRDRDSMPPPSVGPPPLVSPHSAHRGGVTAGSTSFRARGIRGRGVTRVFTRRPIDVSLAARKRTLVETYAIKRRILTGRTTDYLRRLKSIKLRSAALLSARRDPVRIRHGDSEDEIENWDDLEESKDVLSDNEMSRKSDYEDDEIDGEKRKKTVCKVVKKVVPKKKVMATDEDKDISKDDEKLSAEKGDKNEDLEDTEEAAKGATEHDDANEPKMKVTIKQDSETRAVSDESSAITQSKGSGYRYIRLYCPHCKERYITFKDYQVHLRSIAHSNSMRKLSLRLKHNLARMRVDQRIQQRVDEKNDAIRGVTSGRTNFCHTCKLNYRQDRTRHIESEMHKKMKEFLMPSCVICRIGFRSPMLYENHICSLDHIKMEERMVRVRDRDHHVEKEVDMDSLLVLDSVGSADESESDTDTKNEEAAETEKKEKKKKKEEINLGGEYVKPIAVLFCELCGIYLPRTGDQEISKANHCRTRNHLQRYVRCKNDTALRKEAERLHRREKAEQEARHKAREENKEKSDTSVGTDDKSSVKDLAVETKAEKSSSTTGSIEPTAENVDFDDKIWADVDKGLDELLAEVDEPGNKSSDDDEDSGRYDRFRYSDKKGGKTASDGDPEDHVPDTNNEIISNVVVKKEEPPPKAN